VVNYLKCHPFPVVAYFEQVVAVSFAFPEAILQPLVPKGLEMDIYEGFGFITVAMVWTRDLRPAGFPAVLGKDFFLAGYRIFTKLRDESGRRLRGLKILRSDTDKRSMVWLGNLMTRYHYHHVDAQITTHGGETRVISRQVDGEPAFEIVFEMPEAEGKDVALPEGSPFPDWRTARRFAGPMPFTFSEVGDGSFVVIEGSRETWKPRPVAVKSWRVALFDKAPFGDAKPILANAFMVRDIAYRWERGRRIRPGGAT